MKRAISPVIAIVVLMLMTVSAAGMAYLTITMYQDEAQSSSEGAVEQLAGVGQSQVKVESISDGKLYLRSIGDKCEGLIVQVGNEPAQVLGDCESSMDVFNINSTCEGGYQTVKVTVGGQTITQRVECEELVGAAVGGGECGGINECFKPSSRSFEYDLGCVGRIFLGHNYTAPSGSMLRRVDLFMPYAVSSEDGNGTVKVIVADDSIYSTDPNTLPADASVWVDSSDTNEWISVDLNVPVSGEFMVILNFENATSDAMPLGHYMNSSGADPEEFSFLLCGIDPIPSCSSGMGNFEEAYGGSAVMLNMIAHVSTSDSYELCEQGYYCVDDSCELFMSVCGDGICGSGEDSTNCCEDCGCSSGEYCSSGSCTVCPTGCDGTCAHEDCQGYDEDCGTPGNEIECCGNGNCGGTENANNCPEDCSPVCGNGVVEGSEICEFDENCTTPSTTSCNTGTQTYTYYPTNSTCNPDCLGCTDHPSYSTCSSESSCQTGTEHYCTNCTHCSDGVCNCAENGVSCPSDCTLYLGGIYESPTCSGSRKTELSGNTCLPQNYNITVDASFASTIDSKIIQLNGSSVSDNCQEFTDGSVEKNLTFSGSDEYEYYVEVPKNLNIQSSVLNIRGFDLDRRKNPIITGSVNFDDYASDVFVNGNYAYLTATEGVLQVIDISDPSDPSKPSFMGSDVKTPGNSYGVFVSGDYAYVADGYDLIVVDVSDPSSISIVGSVETPGLARDVFVSGNQAFVTDWENFGSDSGLRTVNITDPTNPSIIGYYNTSDSADGIFVSGDYAYLVANTNGFHVVNISNSSDLSQLGFIDTPGEARGVFVSGNRAYVADGPSGLQVIDITTPSSPSIIDSVSTTDEAKEVFVSGNFAYVADWRVGGLQVVNITVPSSSSTTGFVDTPDSSWGVFVSGDHAYVADGGSGLQVIDVSAGIIAPTVAGSLGSLGEPRRIFVDGNYAYLADDDRYDGGLRVVDISDPYNPSSHGFYDVNEACEGVFVDGDYAYLSVMEDPSRFQVINVSDPSNPSLIGSINTDDAMYLVVDGDYVYLSAWGEGLRVIDVSDPSNPFVMGYYNVSGGGQGISIDGDYAYLVRCTTDPNNFMVLDVSDPSNPSLVGSYTFQFPEDCLHDIFVSGDYAYVTAGGNDGFKIIDVSDPSNPSPVGSLDIWSPNGIFVSGDYAYVISGDLDKIVYVIDISNPSSPSIKHSSITTTGNRGIFVDGDYAYVADYTSGIKVIKIHSSLTSNPWLQVGGSGDPKEWSYSGDYVGTQQADLNTTLINDYLSTCTPDSDGNCELSLQLHSDTGGVIQIDSLEITSSQSAKLVNEAGSTLWSKTGAWSGVENVTLSDLNAGEIKNYTLTGMNGTIEIASYIAYS